MKELNQTITCSCNIRKLREVECASVAVDFVRVGIVDGVAVDSQPVLVRGDGCVATAVPFHLETVR